MRSWRGLTTKPVARFGLALARDAQRGPVSSPRVQRGEVARASTETAQEAAQDRSLQEAGRDTARERALRLEANLEGVTATVRQARSTRVSLEPTPRSAPRIRQVAITRDARAERVSLPTTIVPSEDPMISNVQAARAARIG